MIHITPTATQEILRLRLKQRDAGSLLRLAVQSGGCYEWSYHLEFGQRLEPEDVVYRCDQVQVVIDERSLQQVEGLTIDYSEDLMGGGFRFDNPNASQVCGCSYSFTLKSMHSSQVSG
ncbi:MAG: iron-sulfur cluster assembly accessory protein [Oscillatoriales cyanobacterium RM1_1_9]|nr:iron-sulfur cluster assembly accessory protein [Oscillatoriales cyanobacterium SM2_3_0]NJO44777.1 iron-sulfur cluster assembly accessory protein [Oscillatoriales cyanobacterium RM2_1_1]NJO70641.1 iron-sulfur cluster assembly accessory protein [Oscillatoriales cyanobacterium RM1_1_9]